MEDERIEDFTRAQERVLAQIEAELTAGRKESHWMWFVFPQAAGLGQSAVSERFALEDLDEAQAYLAHPVLGERLRRWTGLVLAHEDRRAIDIFGMPDCLKFRSSMTLFAMATEEGSCFHEAIDRYFEGRPCSRTVALVD